MVLRGGIFLGKWLLQEVIDGKFNVQSVCALNTRYVYARVTW
jgi:hypothetical protein